MIRLWVFGGLFAAQLCAGPVEFGRSELNAALDAAGIRDLRITTELGTEPAESYRIDRGARNSVTIRGGDLRGLMYGLLDAAEQIRTTLRIAPVQSQASMPIRGVRVFVHSEAVEREHTREYWLAFIRMLARNRFNRFNWVFAHQTDYLAPPYPFWVSLPDFPSIQATGLTPAQREQNLEMLRFVSQTAADHGIDFTLGIWEHNIQPNMKPSVSGLNRDNIGPYSYAALKAVLHACPAIRGIQMRTNSESGIPADQQVEFYREWVFRAIRESGRLINLEVRGWLMQKGLFEAALAAGVPLRLSSKYWAEDMGRPYQPAETWPNYSFLNFLERTPAAGPEPDTKVLPMLSLFQKPAVRVRPYDFYWEVWGLGSHRLLLWGDPDFARRAARTFTLSDTQGFEIDPPLAQRGFGDSAAFGIYMPGQQQRVFWQHDFERYWMFYLLWGRLSYNPETTDMAWMGELNRRFGPTAAPALLAAYRSASRILSEIVAVHLADPNMYVWPEINPGGLIEAYRDVRPSDWTMVASVREAVRNRVEAMASAKQTPSQTAGRLHAVADATLQALDRVRKDIRADHPEWVSTDTDFQVLANLARYHARKMVAADGLTAFYETGTDSGLYAARRQLTAARDLWKRIVELTAGVYPEGMSFAPDDNGHWQDKLPYVLHDLKLVEDRIAIYEQLGLFDRGFDFGGPIRTGTGTSYRNDPYVHGNSIEPRFELVTADLEYSETSGFGWVTKAERVGHPIPTSAYLTIRAVAPTPGDLPSNTLFGDWIEGKGPQVFRVRSGPGRFSIIFLRPDGTTEQRQTEALNGVLDVVFPEGTWSISGLVLKRLDEPKRAVEQVWPEERSRPLIEHTPPVSIPAARPLTLATRVTPAAGVTAIRLYYRPLNQLEKFRVLTMEGSRVSFTVPGEELSTRWDLQYYFEVLHNGNGGWFHPNPAETTPYFVVRVQ